MHRNDVLMNTENAKISHEYLFKLNLINTIQSIFRLICIKAFDACGHGLVFFNLILKDCKICMYVSSAQSFIVDSKLVKNYDRLKSYQVKILHRVG